MFTQNDKNQITGRGSNEEEVLRQIENFKKGFPFLHLEKAASAGDGILALDKQQKQEVTGIFEKKLAGGLSAVKFVPASGAASRMFKSLFEVLEETGKGIPAAQVLEKNKQAQEFAGSAADFAFYSQLSETIKKAGAQVNAETLIRFLLDEKGLNYGKLPKGLLKFHKYPDGERTAFEEHLAEGALYAKTSENTVSLHFTVSPEHQPLFEKLLKQVKARYEAQFGVRFFVGFSRQKPSTDTIAVGHGNEPFREPDGSLLFRPAGHGALLENLNSIDADLIFIKNIDNVVPDKSKEPTAEYKKVLAGVLLKYQERIFHYQKEFNEKHYTALSSAFLAEAANFLENELNTIPPENLYYTEKETLYRYLKEKYNRPARVCGMVKNEGEPGGGPFWARNPDYTVSLQIAESSQIDFSDELQATIARHATHFNPVDLVCAVKNYKGEKFNLPDFRDPETGFISVKSKDGKELKAQELPGLWNGAMSDWITLFVEVPVETFNPVKTVNDLLRPQHR